MKPLPRSSSFSVSRREALRRGALAAAATVATPYLVPAGVLAADGRPGPNDRIGVGYIGVGRRGNQLMQLPKDARIVAAADFCRPRADEVAAKRSCRAYYDYRKLLEAQDVDAVVIATPDHWHVLPAIHACQAGKDLYVEKPLSLTIREGRLLARWVRKTGRVLQTGSQRRSMADHRLGCELVRNGVAGRIHTVRVLNYPSPWEARLPAQPVPAGLDWDAWCGMTEPVPFHNDIFIQRSNPGWISLRPYSGGEMTGTGAHGLDQVQWALDMDGTGPVEVWCEGGKLEPLAYTSPESRARGDEHASRGRNVTFRYASGIVVELVDNGPAAGGEFIGELGKIRIGNNRVDSSPADLAKTSPASFKVRLPVSDDHLANWCQCIKSRQQPIADVDIGHRSATVCHLGNIARWTGRRLRWDPAKEVFPDDAEANQFLDRPRRKPYELPETGV
jgi:predicted dehydrogenase